MADQPRSPKPDLYTMLGYSKGSSSSILDISKAYKFLTMKWHNDKHSSHKTTSENEPSSDPLDSSTSKKHEERIASSDNATTSDGFLHHRHSNRKSVDDSMFLRRSFLSKSSSRRSHTPTPSSVSRSMSRRSTSAADLRASLTRNSSSKGFLSRNSSSRRIHSETEVPAATPTMSRTVSRKSSTPIVFSQTAARKKPAPVEKKLECTLEELLHGCVKRVKIIRDVISENGIISEEETLKINVKPGWKKGTKITFEGKGDEKPGYLPADIVFMIEEKRHSLFKRRGDDLEIGVEIPLIQALTGCTLSVPLLGGERMSVYIDEIIYPGYEKAIPGQGMPFSKIPEKRGELRITFFVEFPKELSDEQRLDAVDILKQSC